jgi:hypothetical protein
MKSKCEHKDAKALSAGLARNQTKSKSDTEYRGNSDLSFSL